MRSVISIKLLYNFIEITLRHGCSPVNLLYIFKTLFPKNICGGLLLRGLFKTLSEVYNEDFLKKKLFSHKKSIKDIWKVLDIPMHSSSVSNFSVLSRRVCPKPHLF